MLPLDTALALVSFAFVTSITPGPNNIMLTATGANVGIRRGLPHMFGIAVGFAIMIFVVAAGAGAALLANQEPDAHSSDRVHDAHTNARCACRGYLQTALHRSRQPADGSRGHQRGW